MGSKCSGPSFCSIDFIQWSYFCRIQGETALCVYKTRKNTINWRVEEISLYFFLFVYLYTNVSLWFTSSLQNPIKPDVFFALGTVSPIFLSWIVGTTQNKWEYLPFKTGSSQTLVFCIDLQTWGLCFTACLIDLRSSSSFCPSSSTRRTCHFRVCCDCRRAGQPWKLLISPGSATAAMPTLSDYLYRLTSSLWHRCCCCFIFKLSLESHGNPLLFWYISGSKVCHFLMLSMSHNSDSFSVFFFLNQGSFWSKDFHIPIKIHDPPFYQLKPS